MRALLLLAALGGCPEPEPCAETRDLLRTEQGLVVTRDEHGVGWGTDACFQCHQVWNIHQADCIDAVEIDLEAIREVTDPDDATTCVPCHGANGVPWLEPYEEDER